MYSKQTNLKVVYSWNNMWLCGHSKTLASLKWESGTSLHAVQNKWQPSSIMMFCSYYFKNDQPRHFVLMFCAAASLVLFLGCSWCFCQNQGFCSYKIVLIKRKECSRIIWLLKILSSRHWLFPLTSADFPITINDNFYINTR